MVEVVEDQAKEPVPQPKVGTNQGLRQPLSHIPHLRVRESLPWWHANGATPEVLQLLREGMKPSSGSVSRVRLPDYLPWPQEATYTQEQAHLALEILKDYQAKGAVKLADPATSKYRIPWFVLTKPDMGGLKHRLICNAQKLNKFMAPQKFRMDHWAQIFPFLRQGWWGAKIDLKDAYFHLPVHKSLRPYLHLEVLGKIFEFQCACFGVATIPYLWTTIMKTFLRKWRQQNIMVFIYLDDILLLGPTQELVQKHLDIMLNDLQSAGMLVNTKKSLLLPAQLIPHLGFIINLEEGRLQLPPEKLKAVRLELGKLLKKDMMHCRKMAAILGSIRSFLMALPFLRAFSDLLMEFINQHSLWGWDTPLKISSAIKTQVRELNSLTQNWPGRPFYTTPQRTLYSDSSDLGWGVWTPPQGPTCRNFGESKALCTSMQRNCKPHCTP